jgi:hypothetical protein
MYPGTAGTLQQVSRRDESRRPAEAKGSFSKPSVSFFQKGTKSAAIFPSGADLL